MSTATLSNPGTLIRARGREWVVLPESCDAVLCGMLPPAVTASVRDAVDGGTPAAAGPVPLVVGAPGYVPQSRTVDVPPRQDDSCCPLLFEPQQVDIALVPL